MLALRYYDQKNVKLEMISEPKPGENEVLIKVTDAGISQTQINEFLEGPFFLNKDPHPLTKKRIPLIPCQEYGGIVVDVGKGVDPGLIGKMVAVLPLIYCGECEYCKEGKVNLCRKMAYHGLLGADGGFCEYSVVNIKNIFLIDDESLLTFIEPILVAIHSYRHALKAYETLTDKNILVLGAGAIGITVASIFKDFANVNVVVNDVLQKRLKRAEKSGFVVLGKEELDDEEFDIVVDAAGMCIEGLDLALTEGFEYLKRGGILINIGTYFFPVSFVPSLLLLKEQSLITSIVYDLSDIKLLDDVLSKLKIDFSIFIDEIPLSSVISEGFYRAEVDKDSFTRLVVKP